MLHAYMTFVVLVFDFEVFSIPVYYSYNIASVEWRLLLEKFNCFIV